MKVGSMKTSDLPLFKAPPTVDKPHCRSCKAFAPECLVPVGDGAAPMCWLCAHHVVDHDCPVEDAWKNECECMPEDIYPAHVIAARNERKKLLQAVRA